MTGTLITPITRIARIARTARITRITGFAGGVALLGLLGLLGLVTLLTLLLNRPVLVVHLFSDVHIRLLVITLDSVRTAVKMGTIFRSTVIFHLVAIRLDTVAMTVARLVAALLAIVLILAMVTALASAFLVVATVLVFALMRLVAALAVLVTATLFLMETLDVRRRGRSFCSGHGNQSEQKQDGCRTHDESGDAGCSCSSDREAGGGDWITQSRVSIYIDNGCTILGRKLTT